MKRIICFLLMVMMIATLVGCDSSSTTGNSTEPTKSDSTSTTGKPKEPAKSDNTSTTEVSEESQLIDYSGFGFNNMYGLTEWIKISSDYKKEGDYYLSGCDAYFNIYDVTKSSEVYQILNFQNGYIEVRNFGKNQPLFTGDRSLGKLEGTYQYHTVNNSLVAIKAHKEPNVELKVKIWEGIPLIKLTVVGNDSGLRFLDGIFIPTKFLDTGRSEIYEETTAIYCIDGQYIAPRAKKYYDFAQAVMKAAYKDFDASAVLDFLHPEVYKYCNDQFKNFGEGGVDFREWLSQAFLECKGEMVGEIDYSSGSMYLQNDYEKDNVIVSFERLLLEIANFEEDGFKINADDCGFIRINLSNNGKYSWGSMSVVEAGGKIYIFDIFDLTSAMADLMPNQGETR